MKKLLSIIVCLVFGINAIFAAATLTVKVSAENEDGTTPVGGTVTLTATKSSSGQNNSVSTGESGTDVSLSAKGYDGISFLGGLGKYDPIISLTVDPADGYYVEGVYSVANGTLNKEGIGNIEKITSSNTETKTYKVVFVKRSASTPEEINYQNYSELKFYTGTELDQITSAFYKEKKRIDLSSVFGLNGELLFDKLYLFGMTTGKDGAVINNPTKTVGCNASTTLYVYNKSGDKYVFDSEVDATVARYDHGTSMNGKKLYFTGYCPFANIGTQASDNGWMSFSGGKNEKVDIYLDDCIILGRYRSSDGSANLSKFPKNIVDLQIQLSSEMKTYLKGFSSIFVFKGTNVSPYTPTIHIKGNNHLKGQWGYITEVTALGKSLADLVGKSIKNVDLASAPITLYTESGFVHLVLDDVWPAAAARQITNGFLRLDSYPIPHGSSSNIAEKSPSIDLGSEQGKLTINGGQYCLRNNASMDGQYTSNLAISYRKFSEGASGITVSLYGFGNDMTDAPVVINSGTFTMYPNLYGRVGEQYYLDDNYYDLRLPAGKGKSQINGGTFNEIANVVFCSAVSTSGGSPINAMGDWLCLSEVEVEDDLTDDIPIQSMSLPESFVKSEDFGHNVVYNDLTIPEQMGEVIINSAYGGQSMNAYERDGNKYVQILLAGIPLGCTQVKEALYRNWAFALPDITVTSESAGLGGAVGGDIEVGKKSGESTIDVYMNQLMYVDMEGLENVELPDDVGSTFKFNNKEKPRGNIINADSYEFSKHLNIMKVVDADQWYCFTAPFNITKVSVLEVDEKKVSAYKNDKNKAIAQQVESNANFWINVQGSLAQRGERYGANLTFEQMFPSNAKLIDLVHYNGKNLLTANYYLYELDSLNGNGEFTTDATGKSLNIDWKPVKRNADEPLMYQGKTYAIQFPYCPMCNDLGSRTYYDYWSKKFIRFYGVGPQTINGSNMHSTITNTQLSAGHATLVGNYTLADMTNVNGYMHKFTKLDGDEESNDWFVYEEGATVKPTQGYMLFGVSSEGMPTRISRSGKMEFDENVSTDVDGLPTIKDHTSLMLFDAMDGFELLSLHDQMVIVYNMQGYVLYQQYMTAGEQVHIAAAPGIYVVKGEKEAIKLVVD